MNPRTRYALESLLLQQSAWNKDGKLKHAAVSNDLRNTLEGQFYDEWYWPKAARFARLCKALSVFPGAEWETLSLGHFVEIKMDWTYDAELAEAFECVFYDEIQVKWGEWLEWPSEEEMLALEIRPPLVWERVNEDGTVQPSMF